MTPKEVIASEEMDIRPLAQIVPIKLDRKAIPTSQEKLEEMERVIKLMIAQHNQAISQTTKTSSATRADPANPAL